MSHPKIAVIDFDGTLCTWNFPDVGEVQPDAREALLKLKELGYLIQIHSYRTVTYWDRSECKYNRAQHIALIHQFMQDNELPYDELIVNPNMDKPMAELYIDDRAVGYRGNWLDVIRQVHLLDKPVQL